MHRRCEIPVDTIFCSFLRQPLALTEGPHVLWPHVPCVRALERRHPLWRLTASSRLRAIMLTATRTTHDRMANAIRALAMDAVEQAKSGHPGLPMGAADIATVLFARFLKFDAADPRWPDRDRFVLSAGHGSMLIYALLH